MFGYLEVVYLWQAVDRQNTQTVFIKVSCRLGIQGGSFEQKYRYKLLKKYVYFKFLCYKYFEETLCHFHFGTKRLTYVTCFHDDAPPSVSGYVLKGEGHFNHENRSNLVPPGVSLSRNIRQSVAP